MQRLGVRSPRQWKPSKSAQVVLAKLGEPLGVFKKFNRRTRQREVSCTPGVDTVAYNTQHLITHRERTKEIKRSGIGYMATKDYAGKCIGNFEDQILPRTYFAQLGNFIH